MRRPARLLVVPVLAASVLALAACGSDSDDSPTVDETPAATSSPTGNAASASASASKSATAEAGVEVVEIELTGSKVSPPTRTVKVDKGTDVKVVITRDTDGEVHVHGYDLDDDAKAGVPVVFDFTADKTGVFEIEAHDPSVLLARLQVS